MGKWNVLLAVIAILLVVMVVTPRFSQAAPDAAIVTPVPVVKADLIALENALRIAGETSKKAIPAYLIYQPAVDHFEISQDGKTALVWMALLDPQTKKPVATEPGLAIAKRTDLNSPWQMTLPTAKDYSTMVQNLPETLLSKDKKSLFGTITQSARSPAENKVYSGYLLPWEGGKRVWLTGSVAHFTTYNSCSWVSVNGESHSTCSYAFDFANGTMFRLLASRGGSVIGSRWTCVDNDHNCLNYIALEDTSTSPVTTAIYLHLAQNSIPAALRINGTFVNQGDFIGLADNTGLSTGHHLHFMVVANRWMGSGYGGSYWWGDSVDITFDEVDVNGGRPRLCSEAYYTPQYGVQCHIANTSAGEYFDNWYISGNRGSKPPTA
ncbi:MAG: M23 family metallopeptidase, partial [Saprospiraceae bacterium]|nr:M23 family metallopeptidase [Saprospiraceae bacterium]